MRKPSVVSSRAPDNICIPRRCFARRWPRAKSSAKPLCTRALGGVAPEELRCLPHMQHVQHVERTCSNVARGRRQRVSAALGGGFLSLLRQRPSLSMRLRDLHEARRLRPESSFASARRFCQVTRRDFAHWTTPCTSPAARVWCLANLGCAQCKQGTLTKQLHTHTHTLAHKHERTNLQTNGQRDGRTDTQENGSTDARTDGRTRAHAHTDARTG